MPAFLKFSAAQRRHIRHSYPTVNPSQITRRWVKSKGYDTKKHFVEHMKLSYSVSSTSGTIAEGRRRSRRVAATLRRALTFNPRFSTGTRYARYAVNVGTTIAQKYGDAEIGTLLRAMSRSMERRLDESWALGPTKAYLTVGSRVMTDTGIEDRYWSGKGAAQVVTKASFLNWLDAMITELENMQEGYGVNIIGYKTVMLSVARFQPIQGSTYPGPLPKCFHSKKCVNIRNKDEYCFLYAVWLGLLRNTDLQRFKQLKNKDRIAPYKEEAMNTFKRGNLSFPMPVMDIPKFEKLNGLRINVFEYTGDPSGKFSNAKIEPLYISDSQQTDEICLMLWHGHYVLLDWKAFTNRDGEKHHYCSRCFSCHRTPEALAKHKLDCHQHKGKKVVMPAKGVNDDRTFAADHMRFKLPGFMVADFEAALVDDETSATTAGKTRNLNHHESASWQYQVCLTDGVDSGGLELSKRYVGENAALNFIETLRDQSEGMANVLWPEREMTITAEEQQAFTLHVQTEGYCPQCGSAYKKGNVAHRHHCHSTGRYVGPLCMTCNTAQGKKYKNDKFIPIFFHNLKGYDASLLFREIRTGCLKHGESIQAIALNSERFIGFTVKFNTGVVFRFLDSNAFLQGSLDTHLSNLDNDKKYHLKSHFNEDELEFVFKKGFFPYEWFNDAKKLDCPSLPPRECWSSKLSDSEMSEADYAYCQLIWSKFNMKTFRDWHNLYLTIDVLGLADVMVEFRKVSYDDYGLDPLYAYTLPGFSWQCMLSGVGREGNFRSLRDKAVHIQLLSDYEMHMFVEAAIRGGISMISHRYAEFNNRKMGEAYDPTRPSVYGRYLDANNLYGGAMSEALPIGGYRWMSTEELNTPILSMNDCFVEVDVTYPKELHDLHSDYPFLPERLSPSHQMLSPYQQGLLNKMPDGKQIRQSLGKQPKLIPTLRDRTKYVVHIEELKCAVRHGVQVTRVHRGLAFKSEKILKPYIDFNTAKRAKAKNDFEKAFYKLMNNAVFGKTMESKRDRSSIKYINNEDELASMFRRQNFKRVVVEYMNPDTGKIFMGLEQVSLTVKLDTPVPIGAAILALSKVWMYSFHYDVIKKNYGDKAQLLMTDTDSLFYAIQTDDFEQDMMPYMKAYFDSSNYDADDPFHSKMNKKVVYKMKNEFGSREPAKYVGIRAKQYSVEMVDPPNPAAEESWERAGGINKCKGVSYARAKRTTKDQSHKEKEEQNITFNDYKTTIFNGQVHQHAVYRISSKQHQLYTVRQLKKSLAPFDDKRYLVNEVKSLAYGHYSIAET